ncbi:hypothetical protein CTheo_7716 [Ceratobasidium theobromae]|uniref:T6SS Phospholipase effector Tle1-like catalytic domain-containing protein n=1 Tax=Ceratobasidium theobromae TaxID=1582974 RepID=A0A5N5QB24_9AGAM|nr:hypothetical protein CTheo_7716 [Ceratobasidium theobromae]
MNKHHSIPALYPGESTIKDILVFCDGSGKDGSVKEENCTNVGRLYKLFKSKDRPGSAGLSAFGSLTSRPREIIYIPGVGSGPITNPANLLARLFGTTIVQTILDAYSHIAKHYEEGDDIYLFGYSRGAFAVRKVASLIHRVGIIRNTNQLLKLWDQYERPVPWDPVTSQPTSIPIKALVVWDTVGAIHSPPNLSAMNTRILGMPKKELPPNVQHAFHVVAFHENRRLFRVTLFELQSADHPCRLKEVWFPGAHSDVGGGGSKEVGLPDVSLAWVIGELQAICTLAIPHEKLQYPLELKKLAPSDAYHESPPWKRLVDKCEPRLRLFTPSSLVHETVLYLRNAILFALDPRPQPTPHVLTIKDLDSIGWDIKACIVARNAFETLKQVNACAQEKLKEQAASYRSRFSSLYMPRTRKSTGVSQVEGDNEHLPRSRRTSTASQGFHEAPTPLPPNAPLGNARLRAESHAVPRSRHTPPGEPVPRRTPSVTSQSARSDVFSGGVVAFREPTSKGMYSPKLDPLYMRLGGSRRVAAMKSV